MVAASQLAIIIGKRGSAPDMLRSNSYVRRRKPEANSRQGNSPVIFCYLCRDRVQ